VTQTSFYYKWELCPSSFTINFSGVDCKCECPYRYKSKFELIVSELFNQKYTIDYKDESPHDSIFYIDLKDLKAFITISYSL